jgi:hypothetical protein
MKIGTSTIWVSLRMKKPLFFHYLIEKSIQYKTLKKLLVKKNMEYRLEIWTLIYFSLMKKIKLILSKNINVDLSFLNLTNLISKWNQMENFF